MEENIGTENSAQHSARSGKVRTTIGGAGAMGAQLIWDFVETAVVALAICVVVYLFIARPHMVIGSSMETSFHDGEYLLTNQFAYKFGEPQRGDVVVFKHSESQDYIKRIIGLPGEMVSVRDGKVLINGGTLNESDYLLSSVKTQHGAQLKEGESMTLGEDEYFVLGDNRSHSSDSRTFGLLKGPDVKGKAWIVYWPLSEVRVVKSPSYN